MIKLIRLYKLFLFIGAKLGPVIATELVRNPNVLPSCIPQLFISDFLECFSVSLGEIVDSPKILFPLEDEMLWFVW